MVVNEPVGAPHTIVFFVGEPHHHETAGWAHSGECVMACDGEHHAGKVFHVDGTTAPDPSVNNVTTEGWIVPVVSVNRDDVDVAVNQESMGVVPGNDDAVVSAAGARCQVVSLNANIGEFACDVVDALVFSISHVGFSGVDGRDTDEVLGEGHCFLAEGIPVVPFAGGAGKICASACHGY